MKLSDFDKVRDYVDHLRKLETALDAAKFNRFEAKVYENDVKSIDISDLTSPSQCREALSDILRADINTVKKTLHLLGVEIDA